MNLIKETQTRKSLLAYLADTSTACSEEAVDNLVRIMNPTPSRKTMGKAYEETLGYNPINHFDISDVIAAVDRLIKDKPDATKDVKENRDAIVSRAHAIFEERRDEHLKDALARAIAEFASEDDAIALSIELTGSDIVSDEFAGNTDTDDLASAIDVADEEDDPELDIDDGPEFTFDMNDEEGV